MVEPARAFPAPAGAARVTAGVSVAEARGLGIATILVRDRARAAAALGLAAPEGPRVTGSGSLALIGLGPAQWLAVDAAAAPDFAAGLAARLTGAAYVSDQSSAFAVLHLNGPRATDLLSQGMFLDLDRFAPGDAAATTLSHMSVLLWREGDRFSLAAFRSYAGSLWHWLTTNAAEYDLDHHD